MSELKAIPTNVITGFLGVGKSTAIMELFKQKPDNERWAVLVNEFGEVGIDGSLLQGGNRAEQGVYIREVPGGCMCCVAGLPMQIALNMLLARAKPHRLLIEPTGLGHPKEVLDALSAEHFSSVLDLRATLTLVDARKLQDSRYTEHQIFNQQLAIADVIVANKADQYSAGDFPALLKYLEGRKLLDNTTVYQGHMGQLKREWLTAPTAYRGHSHQHQAPEVGNVLGTETKSEESSLNIEPELPACGYLGKSNQGEGFHSQGWIFKPSFLFNRDRLYETLTGLEAERIKGVFITEQGIFAYNKADEVLSEYEIDDTMDSRIECIAMSRAPLDQLEQKIVSCIVVD